MTRFALIFCVFISACLGAQTDSADSAPPAAAADSPSIPDDDSRVAVLGYHDFSQNAKETAMRIRTSKFRKQMETLRQLGISVISMDDFIAWKKGEKSIPGQAVLLTFDDGWRSVYTDAFPVLKELGYPFTIFLYKNYVDGGGKALTIPMIEEMMKSGASIGSHSVSHPYPLSIKASRKKGADPYDAFLRKEMGESKRFLEAKFNVKVTSYCYPGGFYTEEMLPLATEFGYSHCFTVIPGKVKRSTPNATVPRYIILGNHDPIFDLAATFREAQGAAGPEAQSTAQQAPPYPVTPESGAVISSRLPEISVNLSKVENLDPAQLVMRVSGFGEVPAIFNPETQTFSWQVNRRLRQPTCQVLITWKDTAGNAPETPLRWSFQLDHEAAYLPEGE